MKKMDLTGANTSKEVSSAQGTVVNFKKLQEVQDRTYEDMLQQLMLYDEVNIERPPGFGKTKMFMQFAADYPQERILYIFDTRNVVDDIMHKYNPTNVDFMSYAMLSSVESRDTVLEKIVEGNYFAIIFDESHWMGGANIKATIMQFLPYLKSKGCKRIGGTATPLRMDGSNVTAEFFSGHTVYEYGIGDAINDGIMLEPLYCMMIGTQQRIDSLREKYKDNSYTVDRLNQLEQAYAKRIGAYRIYRETMLELYNGKLPSYMRIIAYFPTINACTDNAEKLKSDLQQAFPTYAFRLTFITSDSEHEKNIVHLDKNIPNKTIDLILSVDMLNQAYHSNYLSAIIMRRRTFSNRIYTQQYGRACNVAATQRTAIFDDVGNALIDPVEDLTKLFGAGVSDGKGGWSWWDRTVRNVQIHVTAEQLAIEAVLKRIRLTAGVTMDFKEKAKKLMGPIFNAPDDAVVQMTRLPLWFVQELRTEMEAEQRGEV